jgi:hypothetical protein
LRQKSVLPAKNTDMSQQTKREVLVKLRRGCARAGSLYKRQLLDQAVGLFDYHRKPARKPCTPRSTLSNFWFRVLGFEFLGQKRASKPGEVWQLEGARDWAKRLCRHGCEGGPSACGRRLPSFPKKGSTG